MSNVARTSQPVPANKAAHRVTRFVRKSLKPVVVKLSRRLSVTYWPGRRRSISAMLVALLTQFVPPFALAAPTGAQVASGVAVVTRPNAASTLVSQGSQNAVINWQSFSIGAGETVRFVQPNAASVALNRVIGSDPSRIFGSLSANGQVFLVNNAGVYFAPGAKVDVGGLVATSMNISDASFMAGKYQFEAGARAGAVSNFGDLRGAYVVLAAPRVDNAGSIDTVGGVTALAAGGRVALDIAGDRLVSLNVDAAAAGAAVVNSGGISADGGKVFMTARSADAVLNTVINTSGIVRAGSISQRNGKIVIDGGNAGTVAVSGTLAASGATSGTHGGSVSVLGDRVSLQAGANIDVSGDAGGGSALVGGDFHGAGAVKTASFTQVEKGAVVNADAGASGDGGKVAVWSDQHTSFAGSISAAGGAQGGNGGFVETSGKQTLAFSGSVNTRAVKGATGTLLLDPTDITISTGATSGGGIAGGTFSGSGSSSTLNVGDLTTALGSTNVVVDTSSAGGGSGNITVSTAVTYTSANSLTLQADNNITVAAPITNSGAGDISLSGYGAISAGNLHSTGGAIAINGQGSISGNNITSGGGNVTMQSGGAISTGAVSAGAGTIAITGSGNVDINGALASTNIGASAIVVTAGAGSMAGMDAGGDIRMTGGSVSVGAGGRATLYTGSIAGSTGMVGTAGAGKFRYNSDAMSANYATPLAAGTYAIYREQPTLTVTADSPSGTYGAATPGLTSLVTGFKNGDTEGNALSSAATVSTDGVVSSSGFLTAGTHSVTAAGASDKLGYAINYVPGTLTITPKVLTVGSVTANNKVYNGNTTATVNTGSATYGGRVAGDAVSVSTSGVFADRNVGTGKTVSLAGTGADAANYTISGSAVANITAKALTIGGITAANKVYDGNMSATVSTAGATYTGLVAGDIVSVGATGAFADKNAAIGKAVTLTSTHSGADVGNYSITDQASATANITPKALTIGGITAANKVYDGNMSATVSTAGATYTGLVAGDVVGVGATGAFADKSAAIGKAVTLTSTHSGADVGNYSITDQASTTASITPKAMSIGGITAANKVYDGGMSATVSTAGATYTGLVAGDAVSVGATGAFVDKNAAAGKAVMLTSTHSGADLGNYSITDQASATANITPKAMTIGGITAANKVYDGGISATVSTVGASYTGLVAGDAVSVGATGAFVDKNAAAGKAVMLTSTHSGADVGNYSITDQASATANITPKAMTIGGITAANKVYDGGMSATVSTAGATYTGLVAGDAVSVGATGAFADKSAAIGKAVTLTSTHSGADLGNYSITDQAGTTANITPKAMTIGGITAANKVYDGNMSATVSTAGATYNGLVAGDAVSVGATGAFVDKNAAAGKAVTLTSTYSGADLGNYSITDQASATANITPKALTIGGITAANKVYDGNMSATVSTAGATYTGLVAGDVVGVGATGAFADKSAAIGKAVTLTSTHSGADVGNYSITDQASTTASITPKAMSIGGITAANKVYDGNMSATVSTAGATYTGLVAGDVVGVGATGAFADKNAAIGKAVTLTSTHSGADVGNYSITDQASTTASITPKAMTIGGITAANKVYDGNMSATVSTAGATYNGLVAGDVVSVGATGAFVDKNAAAGKAVTLTSTHSGADLGNYTISDQASATANITTKALTVGGITAANKVYDGTTSATISTAGATYTGLVAGDAVSVSATGAFADKNAGNGKTVALTATTGGADAANYTFTGQSSATADITPKALTIAGLTAANKVYDGTTSATVSAAGATYTGLVAGDVVGVGATGAFADKSAAIGKAVTLTSTHSGADVGNYSITDQASTTASITPKAMTIGGITAANKVYDGNMSATVSTAGATYNGLVAGDVVSVGATGAFVDKNAAAGKAVTLTSTHSGTDLGNYTITDQASATANITTKALAVGGITAANKVYDGTTSATLSTAGATYTGLVAGDAVSVSATGAFADKNAGHGKTVALTATTGGADAANYTFTGQSSATADITPKALTIGGITAANKVYDGTTAATVNAAGATFSGLVSGDAVSVSATGGFADKNAATGKAVSLTSTHGGADLGNYTITDQASATASITPKAMTIVGITAANKVYDGTTSATVSTAGATYTGLVSGDTVSVSATGTFADKNAGSGKTVSLTATAGGADAANYAISGQSNATAAITPKALTISGGITASNKVYDGTTSASVVTSGATFAGLVAGDAVSVSATGTFADKNAGTGKTVALASTLGGADGSNYSLASDTSTTANITPKSLTIGGITVGNKVYDGTTAATVNAAGASYTGLVAGDAVSVSATGEFADKNAGNGKTVALTSTYSGADARNYAIADQASATASVTPKALTIGGIKAGDKGYDGSTSATVSTAGATFAGLVAGDTVSVSATGVFADKNAAAGKTVTLSSTHGGKDAANYAIADQASTTASIAPKALTIGGITAANKVYDGSVSATVNTAGATFAGLVAGDAVSVSATGTFADKNVGSGKTVTLATKQAGADAGNYTIAGQASTTADITRLASVSWTGGASGDWSQASNWAGGAIPDMANVAQVVIPAGKTVTFDSAVPALNGAVRIDAVDGAGALTIGSGSLTVANGVRMGAYAQSGGVLSAGSLTAARGFNQAGGSISLTGGLDITQASGSAVLGDIGSASLTVNGSVQQAAGSAVSVRGATSFTAGNGNVSLGNAGNDFNTVAVVSANDVTLVDKNALVLGGTIGGNLATSTGGDLTQAAALKVTGSSAFDAGTHAVNLADAGNDFGGTVGAVASSVALKDSNVLTLGKVKAGSVDLNAAKQLQMAAGGLVESKDIALTVSDPSGAIGTSGTPIAVQAGSTITFGSNSAAVPAYFGGAAPLPVFVFKNAGTQLAYASGSKPLLVNNQPSSTRGIGDAVGSIASMFSQIPPVALTQGGDASIVGRGMVFDVLEPAPLPFLGTPSIKGPE